MSALIDSPITWRSLIRIGLAFAAEYAVLGLIEDAPVALKAATVVCATLALVALESDAWLRRRGKYLFAGTIVVIGAIYFGFVGYAINHVVQEARIREKLDELYVASVPIMSEAHSIVDNRAQPNEEEVTKWKAHIESWRDETHAYIQDNLGLPYGLAFLNTLGHQGLIYTQWPEVNAQMNYLVNLQNNLQGIREKLAPSK